MRIVHINTADNEGGAARAAFRLHTGLLDAGHASTMLVGRRVERRPEIADVRPAPLAARAARRAAGEVERLTGLQYLLGWWGEQIASHPFVRDADVIHLHNLHGGFFPIRTLPALSRIGAAGVERVRFLDDDRTLLLPELRRLRQVALRLRRVSRPDRLSADLRRYDGAAVAHQTVPLRQVRRDRRGQVALGAGDAQRQPAAGRLSEGIRAQRLSHRGVPAGRQGGGAPGARAAARGADRVRRGARPLEPAQRGRSARPRARGRRAPGSRV